MDYSVLWCLGPDFDKQSVLSLLGDSNSNDFGFMQPTTSAWWLSSPSKWNASSMLEPPIYTPRSITSELGPQSPTSGVNKRPFSDVTNRTASKRRKCLGRCNLSLVVNRPFTGNQPIAKPEFCTPVRSLTPDLYNRLPSSIKRSRMTPALVSSTYETPPPPAPLSSAGSTIDSAEFVFREDPFHLIRFLSFRIDELWKLHCFSKNILIVPVYSLHLFKNIKAGLLGPSHSFLNLFEFFLQIPKTTTCKRVIYDETCHRYSRLWRQSSCSSLTGIPSTFR